MTCSVSGFGSQFKFAEITLVPSSLSSFALSCAAFGCGPLAPGSARMRLPLPVRSIVGHGREGRCLRQSVFKLNPNTQKLHPRSTLAENMLTKDFPRSKEASF